MDIGSRPLAMRRTNKDSLNKNVSHNGVLTHLAIIMDGNGRWAENKLSLIHI